MSRGKKIAKWTGICLAIAIFIVCLPFLLLRMALSDSVSNKILETVVPDFANAEARIGHIDYALLSSWPDVELGIKDITVISKVFEPADTLLHIDSIGVSVNAGDFLNYGDIRINRLHVDDPHFYIKRSNGKLNAGIELNLFKKLEIQADYFHEIRSKILQYRSYIPPTMGLQTIPTANIGVAKGSGMEVSVDYSQAFNKDFWINARGNFTYSVARYEKYEEPDYSKTTPWKAQTGQKLSQLYGLVAERLFIDEEEVKNSPVQTFGEYMAGDIKYKDINDDGRINDLDMVPIGYPSMPEIIYGFGASLGFRNFDFSFFMQGSGRSSFFIDASATQPFVNGTRAILQAYADDHWSEDNRNSYALWPRLSTTALENNTQPSTWWLRDGSFLRLKTIEIGYSLPDRIIRKAGMTRLRIYVTGDNLAVFSPFKMWDPEQADGLGYPLQRVFNIGLNVEF